MKVEPTDLPGVLVITPLIHPDRRGHFFESWQADRYARLVTDTAFVQDSVSVSHRGVIRGMHFQHPRAQGKLVSVLAGAAFDVVLDVRRGAPTFGRWFGMELTASEGRQLWIPPGFAHGFQALAAQTVFLYKCTEFYATDCERTVRFDDPALQIAWPLAERVVSPRDAAAPALAELPSDLLPAGL